LRNVYTILHIQKKWKDLHLPLLCKKYREAGKIKTEVVANLTKFPEEAVLAIAGALKKGKDIMVSLKDIVVKKSIDYGFVFILLGNNAKATDHRGIRKDNGG